MTKTKESSLNDTNKSWKEVNKIRKEQKKKWKEEKLLKKLRKVQENKQTEKLNSIKEIEVQPIKLSTISIAVPGSILDNAQSAELRTYLAGQIARAACVFQIDEVIIFDDLNDVPEETRKQAQISDADGIKVARKCCVQLARILQYLECPQYLRKHFFPIHPDLKYAGLANPLDAPNHLRQNDNFIFREGVVTSKPVKASQGSAVNVGLLYDVIIDKVLTPGVRVTVKLHDREVTHGKKQHGHVVAPTTPRQETGVYWGYTVRLATCLSEVFTQAPYKKGYDVTIGTSDKGQSVDDLSSNNEDSTDLNYQHLLIVFGGVHGLEAALECDDNLKVDSPADLFDYYLNTLPNQGSRTIRTEEAILISLAALRPKLKPKTPSKVFTSFDEYAVKMNATAELSRFD